MTSAPEDMTMRHVVIDGRPYFAIGKPHSDPEWGLREPPGDYQQDDDYDDEIVATDVPFEVSTYTGERY